MTTGLLITASGQAAIIADLGGGTNLVLTHVAWGDAAGVPYNPNEAQVALVNEKYRATIASVAVVDGAIVVDAVIPADTNDGSARPSHSFNVAEVGLFNNAGTLIGVARLGNGYKPPPSSGQASIATYRLKLAVANPSAISVVVDPQAQIALGRHIRAPWLTIDGVVNAPPGAPNQGDTYIVGAAPTGAWVGFAHRIAQWVGVWSLSTAPIGHMVCNNAADVGDSGRFLRRTAAGWAPAIASATEIGLVRLATLAETAAGAEASKVVSPAVLKFAARIRLQADTTLYVSPTLGNDANPGTIGQPYQTRQRAWNRFANELDLNGYAGTIKLLNGTYTDAFAATSAPIGTARGTGAVTFEGDPATPTNVVVALTNANCFYAQGGAQFSVKGCRLQTAGANTSGLVTSVGGIIAFENVDFFSCVLAHVLAASGGFIQASGNYTISGGAAIHISSVKGGGTTLDGKTVTFLTTPNFSSAFAVASEGGAMSAVGYLQTGSATGKRYEITSGGIISVGGANPTALPGNAAGTNVGGSYV
ncbi:phage tail protein [Bosea sp. BK604]|uniref:phage tail-collar fiber domain-containing protein n=1 Tax=Bosea sp. BK604 TaxID=2512180 RepID=UPI001043B86E|nr:phage tail protein [Bosea sp. BK604]TCR70528.1 uncharacterized protein DUF2793 [Bosea sp. BK604]